MYLRLHGDKKLYASGYTDAALERWAARVRAWAQGSEPRDARRALASAPRRRASRDVYCYFDNDIKVRAPFDADRLMQMLRLARSDTSFDFPARSRLRQARPPKPLSPSRWRFDRSRADKSVRR
jgi:uncharacterized protein YecE (DUF72 family)